MKGGTFWKLVIILFHELIASGKKLFLNLEVLHLVNSIRVITSIQKSAVWKQFISEVGRSHVVFNLVNLKNAHCANDDQIGFSIPVKF